MAVSHRYAWCALMGAEVWGALFHILAFMLYVSAEIVIYVLVCTMEILPKEALQAGLSWRFLLALLIYRDQPSKLMIERDTDAGRVEVRIKCGDVHRTAQTEMCYSRGADLPFFGRRTCTSTLFLANGVCSCISVEDSFVCLPLRLKS
jgi:hypothetical protein